MTSNRTLLAPDLLRHFPAGDLQLTPPEYFPSPFVHTPHPLATHAAKLLQRSLTKHPIGQHDFFSEQGGKMLGALVVKTPAHQLGYLCGFSGMLAGRWESPGFVPPLFDLEKQQTFLPSGETKLAHFSQQINHLKAQINDRPVKANINRLRIQEDEALREREHQWVENKLKRQQQRAALTSELDKTRREGILARLSHESQQDKREKRQLKQAWAQRMAEAQFELKAIEHEILGLNTARKQLSHQLHQQVFETYQLHNRLGEQRAITEFFPTGLPPGGTGDCTGPKLIHYAISQGLTPIALAEFWWGHPPSDGVRHHAQFYPSCRGKCLPILPFMLQGLALEEAPQPKVVAEESTLDIVYEDTDLLLVNKPTGLLSIPGISITDSVLTRLRQRYPEVKGAMLVHRLDLATSGLLLAAKTPEVHKQLQRQFTERRVEKRYVAILSRTLAESEGTIQLPLRVDLDDRPRQLVCHEWGKAGLTHWKVISRRQETTRIYLYPQTGRTHQLRVHAAHRDGLNAPIIGDELYGQPAERLMLHAEQLRFIHPGTGEAMEVRAEVPF